MIVATFNEEAPALALKDRLQVAGLRACVKDDKLHVSVADDGVGMEAPPEVEGIGLANTRARLHELFGGAAQVTLTNGKGVTVEVTMPLRT